MSPILEVSQEWGWYVQSDASHRLARESGHEGPRRTHARECGWTDTAELDAIVADLHRLEATTRSLVVGLLFAVAGGLTRYRACRRLEIYRSSRKGPAGSTLVRRPDGPIVKRASTKTAQRVVTMIATALTSEEAATRLGVRPSRIRQRLGSGRSAAGTALENAHLVSVDRLMRAPHPDLTTRDEILSPIDGPIECCDPERISDLIHAAFVVHVS